MAFKKYNSAEVYITFGESRLTGYADGDFLAVSLASDQYTQTVGSDGHTTRNRTNNLSGTATVTLQHTSDSNAVLLAAFKQDELGRGSNEGAGIKTLQVKDFGGNTLLTMQNAWVMKAPDVSFSREASTREWVLAFDSVSYESL